MNTKYSMLVPPDTIYLNHAALSPLEKEVFFSLQHNMSQMARYGLRGIDFQKLDQSWVNVRKEFAKLINGDPEGVVITSNTASALHIAADGFSHRYKPGQNIVITDIEFTTNSFVWQKLASRYELTLRAVPFNENQLVDFSDYIDENTVIVSVSFVQFSNGYKADLQTISQIAHENGAIFVVDGIQGLGAIPFDVQKLGVDILAAGSQKWTMGPLGYGYCYIRPNLLEEIDSILIGWYSDKEHLRMKHHKFEPWEDAREYQHLMHPNFEALGLSLQMINDLDPKKIAPHLFHLQDVLIQSIEYSNYTNLSDFPIQHRSGIITIGHPNSKAIVAYLDENKIITTLHHERIRISPHWYNTVDDIEILAEALLKF